MHVPYKLVAYSFQVSVHCTNMGFKPTFRDYFRLNPIIPNLYNKNRCFHPPPPRFILPLNRCCEHSPPSEDSRRRRGWTLLVHEVDGTGTKGVIYTMRHMDVI